MYNEVIKALEQAGKDDSVITVITGKSQTNQFLQWKSWMRYGETISDMNMHSFAGPEMKR